MLRRLVNVHIAPSPLCRAAYTERVLKAEALNGTEQYVILGAGLDTFAFRETEFLSKHKVFEADHPLTPAGRSPKILNLFLWISQKTACPSACLPEALISPKNPFSRGWV